ncbi:MAG: hypothetical protein D6736_02370 [Nitrospinota bacterium]|nr:MAG: hypothetical protein D6736_02370 [Nitrospinota bacterium]
MRATVKLSELVGAMEVQSEEIFSYLNKATGEVVTITREELWAAEEDRPLADFPEWQQQEIQLAREILGSEGYIPLPSKYEIHEYAIMERFCLSLPDEYLREKMYRSIKGRGAFRRFKENIYRYDIADEWYRYKEEALRQIAIAWCEENDIPYTD